MTNDKNAKGKHYDKRYTRDELEPLASQLGISFKFLKSNVAKCRGQTKYVYMSKSL